MITGTSKATLTNLKTKLTNVSCMTATDFSFKHAKNEMVNVGGKKKEKIPTAPPTSTF